MSDDTSPCKNPIFFGTAYYPDHWPEEEWPRDLDRICGAGLTSVRFGEFSWSWIEPSPGRFDFGAFDRFVSLVEERRLKLVLCTPTATPPPWFDRLYPDGRLQNIHGQTCLAPRHFWCWNHEESREQARKTIVELATHYRGCQSLWGWQIDNEPNYAEEVNIDSKHLVYDFHPASQKAFVAWLKQRYESIDHLNQAWWSNFWSQRCNCWEDVHCHRVLTNPHAWLDFMRWREAAQAEFVHWQAALLRNICPDLKIGCNIPETGVKASVAIGQDYWAQAHGLDWIGTDLYQATGNRKRDLEKLAYSSDLMRSVADATGAEFILSETQAGPHERCWPQGFAGEGFHEDYLEASAEVFATRGASQIWWFLWRPTHGGVEIGMNGMQNLDGSDSSRTVLANKLTDTGSDLSVKRKNWLKRKTAHIHYSRDSLLYASFWPSQLPALEDSLSGWHALLEEAGFRIEFLNDLSLLQKRFTQEDLLVLPQSSILGDPLVSCLAQTDARILAGPHTAFLNQHGQLCNSRLPDVLATKAKVGWGLWRDSGTLPQAANVPSITGFRTLLPQSDSTVLNRFDNGEPCCAGRPQLKLLGVDLGELFARADAAQRKTLIKIFFQVDDCQFP